MAKKTEWGTQAELARRMNVSPKTIAAWKTRGKLKGLIRKKDGKVNLTRAVNILPGRVSPKHQQSQNARWNKQQKQPPKQDNPETEEEIRSYLDESIGDLAQLDIYELQRRNELEKLLLAQIKRKHQSAELVEAEQIKTRAFEAAKAIKESCIAIADRTAPLVAAEGEAFACKQIILKEVNYILEDLSQKLEVV
jgi:hypothetical protein